MAVALSGSIVLEGSITGSLLGTSSYSSNAGLLNGLDSSVFALTSSLSTFSSSLNGFTSSINTYTASNNANIAALNAATASLYNATASLYLTTASLNQYTASLNTRSASFACIDSTNNFACVQYFSNASNAVSFTSTGSLYSDGGMRLTKDLYVSGTSYFNNVTIFGTQSVNYITSSQLNIASNLITVNTATPTVRFGGLAVYDSGSLGTGLTGSMLWDSEDNQWIYSNPSGSEFDSAVFLVGPRNVGALGNEVGISCNFLSKGDGLHHITSSGIFENGSRTCFYGNSYISSSGATCFGGNVTGPNFYIPAASAGTYGLADLTAAMQTYGGGSPACSILFYTCGVERMRFTSTGIACFACQVCVTGNADTAAGLVINNGSGASGTCQHYINFTAGATTIARMFRGNGVTGLAGSGITIDNFDGMNIRLNQLGGSGGFLGISGGIACFASNVCIGGQVRITTNAEYQLDVQSSTNAAGASIRRYTAGAYAYDVYETPTRHWRTGLLGGSYYTIYDQIALTDRFIIDTSGFVGINETTPSTYGRLTVNTGTSCNTTSLFALGYGTSLSNLVLRNNYTRANGILNGIEFRDSSNEVQASIYACATGANNQSVLIFGTNNGTGGNGLTNATERMRITNSGDVGIGTTDTQSFRLAVNGANATQGDANTTIRIFDTTSATTGTGGGISFGGYFCGTSSVANTLAFIQGGKENSTADNFASFLRFGTRINGGNPTERMRITSGGEVGIGVTPTAGNRFWVKGSSTSSGDTTILAQNSGGTNLFYVLNNGDVVMPNGNVGIGTTSICPSFILHIAKTCSAGLANMSFDNTAGVPCDTGTQGTILRFRTASSDANMRTMGAIASYAMKNIGSGVNNHGDLRFYTGVEGEVCERMRIASNGLIGINNTTPIAPLQIVCTPGSFYGIIETTACTTGTAKHFRVHKPNCVEYGIGILNDNSFHISVASTFPTTTQGFTMTSSGNVGIGITTPCSQLDVRGTITNSCTAGNRNYTIDTAHAKISIASGGYVDFCSMSGMVLVNNWTNGAVTAFLVGGGSTAVMGTVTGTAGAMFYNSTTAGYRWCETLGSTANYGFQVFRTRDTA